MNTEMRPYTDWLEQIRDRAYECTHPSLPACPGGMRAERYEAIRKRIERLYAPLAVAYARFVPFFLRSAEELAQTFETGDEIRRSDIVSGLSKYLEQEILALHSERVEQQERELLAPILERTLRAALQKQEKRLGKTRIETALLEAVSPLEYEYLVLFANGTAVHLSQREFAQPPGDAELIARATERMDISTIWQSFPKDGEPSVARGEFKVFYTLNEPENLASFWAVVDGELWNWLGENGRTVDEVCALFHAKDVQEKRVLRVMQPLCPGLDEPEELLFSM